MERPARFELAMPVWKTAVLPLHHGRIAGRSIPQVSPPDTSHRSFRSLGWFLVRSFPGRKDLKWVSTIRSMTSRNRLTQKLHPIAPGLILSGRIWSEGLHHLAAITTPKLQRSSIRASGNRGSANSYRLLAWPVCANTSKQF